MTKAKETQADHSIYSLLPPAPSLLGKEQAPTRSVTEEVLHRLRLERQQEQKHEARKAYDRKRRSRGKGASRSKKKKSRRDAESSSSEEEASGSEEEDPDGEQVDLIDAAAVSAVLDGLKLPHGLPSSTLLQALLARATATLDSAQLLAPSAPGSSSKESALSILSLLNDTDAALASSSVRGTGKQWTTWTRESWNERGTDQAMGERGVRAKAWKNVEGAFGPSALLAMGLLTQMLAAGGPPPPPPEQEPDQAPAVGKEGQEMHLDPAEQMDLVHEGDTTVLDPRFQSSESEEDDDLDVASQLLGAPSPQID